eukprot:TRINITY_DN91921_c0_g1_i1.p1 TRINITY_DN91921_c0_g1~~TRINITY_DN91921_c0_g1_i1.p1  ORF type:complete len:174 (+),score=22.18 TRINITY_DN91921_c0_g1_i1:76-597(+)
MWLSIGIVIALAIANWGLVLAATAQCRKNDGEMKNDGDEWCGQQGNWVRCTDGVIEVCHSGCTVASCASPQQARPGQCRKNNGEIKNNGDEWCGQQGNWVKCDDGIIEICHKGCTDTKCALPGQCRKNDGEIKEDGDEWCGQAGNWVKCNYGVIEVCHSGCTHRSCEHRDGEL